MGGFYVSIKGQRYVMEIHLSQGVLVPINCENQGVTVFVWVRGFTNNEKVKDDSFLFFL